MGNGDPGKRERSRGLQRPRRPQGKRGKGQPSEERGKPGASPKKKLSERKVGGK